MIKFSRILAAGAVTAALAAGAIAVEPATAAGVIKERQDGFKQHVKNIKAAGEAAKQGTPSEAVGPAKEMAAFAKTIPSLFPEGSTGTGDESRAKPEIWSNWDDFVQAAEANADAAEALAVTAASGTAEEVGAAVKELGKTCGACHDDYRKPKE